GTSSVATAAAGCKSRAAARPATWSSATISARTRRGRPRSAVPAGGGFFPERATTTSGAGRAAGGHPPPAKGRAGPRRTPATAPQASGSKAQGTSSGTDSTGTSTIANNSYDAIVAYNSAANIIGTDSDGANDAGERNVFAGIGTAGILVQELTGNPAPKG